MNDHDKLRALVAKWKGEANCLRWNRGNEEAHAAAADATEICASELEAALAALSQGEAQQPEAVAWALAFAPDDDRYNGGKCVRLTFDAPSKPIKEWSDTAFTARPLIYGDTTPTHDGGEDWKARALSAEADIERMTDTFNRENGPALMGEPVLPPEKMVELDPGVKVPTWLLDHAKRVELYMKANLPGPWRIGGIQSQDFTPPAAKQPEAQAVALKCPNCKGFGYTDEGDQEVGSALFDCDACLGSGLFTVPVGATIADAAYSPDLTMESARNLLRDIASAIKHGGYSHPTTPAVGGGWLPIESAPMDGTYVLLASEHGCWVAKYHPVYQSGYRPENPWSSMMLNHDHIPREVRYAKPTRWKPLQPPAALTPATPQGVRDGR